MPASINNNQITVTNTATQLVPQNPGRQSILIENTDGARTVYIGTQGVTAATGFPLLAGQVLKMYEIPAIYAITASGSAVVAVLEESNA